MAKVKIDYGNTSKWRSHFWYVTPVHGEDFSKKDIPTEWAIQTLDLNGMEGDMVCLMQGFTYFEAKEICLQHNITIWNINRDFDPEIRGVEFKEGMEYV